MHKRFPVGRAWADGGVCLAAGGRAQLELLEASGVRGGVERRFPGFVRHCK